MKRIELAYPLTYGGEDYPADTTVDVDDETAVELVSYGRARWPQEKPAAVPAPRPRSPRKRQPKPANTQE